ncbi:MAG: hypothetical protein O6761_06855 [Thaumarchaeota archaeon]|nr:hypothetical protein [Nitrososphaerota archaeon]
MKRFDRFTSDELRELGRGLEWAENEGASTDLMKKLDDELSDILDTREQTKQSQENVKN